MATRYYDEATGKWVVCGTDKALEINIVDVADNYESTNVEGALREIATTLNEKESEITTIKEQLDDLDSDFRYHLANHPGGSGGGGGTGGGVMPTLTSTFEDGQIIEEGQSVNIPIFFSSPNLGEGIAYIVVNGVEVGNQTISQGNNVINVSAFSSMKNTVSIYAKDRAGLMSNQLSWTIICGGLSATVTFDSEADYSIEDKIIMQYTVTTESTEDVVLHMTIDSAINDYVVEVGYNEFDFTGLSVGVHKISFYLTSGVYKTKTFSFNIVVVDGANLYVSSTFDTSSDITYGVPVNIPYRISKQSTELFDVVFSIDNIVDKTVSVNAGSYYWTINNLTIGEHTLKIEASSLSGEYAFIELVVSVVEGEYTPVEPVTQGLLAWFDATTKSNQDTDKHIWNDKSGNGVMAYLHNFNYFSNGWIDGSLKCDGDSYVEIDMTPYADNVKLGSTIDILYKATNIGIEEARIIDYTQRENPYKGIYANILESRLTSLTNTGSVSLNEDVETRLTFVIDRENKFAKIYVNAVLSRAFYLSDSGSGTTATYEDFSHTEKIYLNSRKGEDLFGNCEIKQLRVYGRALSDDDIVQNHIADIKDLTKQKEKYDFNYNNHSTPELRFYGDMENMTNEVFKTMRVKYTSPNEEMYGQSFDQQYCQVRWQGTSSIQYVLKNFQIYLKDENMTDWYYTPFKDGAKEHILTFKCDYMESSHANNVGIAKFVNDCIYDTKTPAQQANSKLRTTVTGFPVLLYINDEFYCAGNLNLDRFSVNSLGLNSDFPNALSYEVSANTDTTAGAFFPWSSDSGKTELEYLKSDFECRYPENRVQGDDTFAEIKRLIDWVGYATDDMFKEQISQYLNLEYCIRYYLTVLMFGMVDNLGKNMMLNTWDGKIWYPTFYDCDTSTSLDNTGFMKFDCDIEMEANVFNTSNSNLWTKLRRVFETDIKSHYALMRQSNFTEENIMRYLYDEQISQIPEILYNRDAQTKYLNFGAQYLYACHGSREQQIKRWIHERLLFMDSLMDYTVSGSDFITVRANKLGLVYFDIQVFSPQYFSIKFRDEANNTGLITKKVKRGETVRFEYNLPTATDQEIVIYYGRNIKDLGDMSNLQPTTLLLGNATRLTQLICSSQYLINASISDCKMLQRIDLHDSVLLGTGEGAQQTLDVSECTNLKYINIYGTQLTALYTNTNGGNIEEIYYPYSIQTVIVKNQPRLKSIGIPIYYTGQITNENNIYADKLVNVDIANCDELVSLVVNYYEEEITVPTFIGVSRARSFSISNSLLNAERIDLSHSSNMESLTLDSLYQLKEINFDDISVYNAESSNLSNVVITNCPNVETITFNQNTLDGENSLGVAFASGMTLNLSNLLNLKAVHSNVGIKGLTKLILPKTVNALVFDYPKSTQYSQTDSDILDIWSVDCNHTDDDFTGIDLLNMDVINDFSMGSLSRIENAINLDIKITNTFPYFNYFKTENFFEPIGTVDISDYTGSLAYLFKGVNLDKLEIICTKQLTQENASYMFSYASCSDKEKINTLFGFMQSISDISYMFYNAHIAVAPKFPKTIVDCRYTFANCHDLLETPSNWNIVYNVTPTSDYCYLDCNSINLIDDESGTIDDIPVTWGGYGRTDTIYKGYVVDIENTLDREIEYLMVDGVSLQNMIPMKGQTNTLSKDGETFTVEDGFIDYATIVDGSPYQVCEIKGKSVRNILPTETITSQVLVNESPSFNLKDGLNENVVITEEEYVENVLHGQTKVNILESTGNEQDSMLTTNYAKTVQTDNAIDGTILKGVIEGETLQNVIGGAGATEVLTTGGEAIVKTENGLSEGTAIIDGEMPYAVMKGLSLINLSEVKSFSLTGSGSSVKTSISNIFKTNTVYTRLLFITKNTLTGTNDNGDVAQPHIGDVTNTVFFTNTDDAISEGFTGLFQKTTFTTPSSFDMFINMNGQLSGVRVFSVNTGGTLEGWEVIVEGDYTDEIVDYFSGIGSVKMPILTTYNSDRTKTTVLTTPSDLVLRSTDTLELENARDELDLLTGTITRNVGIFRTSEITKQVQGLNEKGETTYFFKLNIGITHPKATSNTKIICYGFPVYYINNIRAQYNFEHNVNGEYDYEGVYFSGQYPGIRVLRSTIDAYTEETVENRILHWLEDINFTVYYALETPYTEQIDLSDQPKPYAYKDGYVNVSSDELIPTLDYQCLSANSLTGSVYPSTTYTIFGDNAEGQILSICGTNFEISSLPKVITSGTTDSTNIEISNGAIDNLMIIEGDYSDRNLEYFTGVKSVVNPIIESVNSDSSKSTTTNLGVTLRGLNDVKDELDIKTGIVTRKIGVNDDGSLYELSSYVTENITVQTQPYIYQGGTINISSDELTPNFNYQAFNRNLLCSLNVKENTEYTIITDSRGLIKFGGNEVDIQNSPQLITTGSTNKVYFNGGKFTLYEKGISHSENIVVKNYNDTNEQLITLDKTVILYSSPNKRDTYNLMTGTWTQNVGTRSYATGDELNENVYTDLITTVYDLDSPVVTEFDSYLTPITKPITYGSVLISGTCTNGKFETPISKFKVKFSNVYETPLLESNATYTIINGNGLKMVLGGKDINVTSNKQVVTSGAIDTQIVVVGEINNTMIIVGDVTDITINGYFKDYCDVVSPSITNSNSEYSTVTTTPDTLILRSVGDAYDTFDFATGIVTRRVSETHTVLSVPFDETIEVTNPPLAYTSGTATISSSSETTIIAKGIVYRIESKTYFPFEQIETNTDYTLYIESEKVGTYVLGGMVSGQTANGIVINSGSRYVAKDLRFTENIGINKIMLLKGDTRDNIIDEYFEGISWVKKPSFTISDGSTEQISTTVADLSLRCLGYTKDTYNVLTGELTRRVGIREYQQGDEENSAVQTDFKQTLYVLDTPIVSTVTISWDGTLMSYYKRTKVESTNSSIHPYLNVKLPVTSLDVIQLKDNEIATLQEESLMTMMALAEMYEMTTVASETSETSTFSLRRRIVITPMASVYYKLYKKGFKDYEEIPEALREQVDYLIETEG